MHTEIDFMAMSVVSGEQIWKHKRSSWRRCLNYFFVVLYKAIKILLIEQFYSNITLQYSNILLSYLRIVNINSS